MIESCLSVGICRYMANTSQLSSLCTVNIYPVFDLMTEMVRTILTTIIVSLVLVVVLSPLFQALLPPAWELTTLAAAILIPKLAFRGS